MPDRALSRAGELEARIEQQAATVALPSFKEVLANVRVYLNWQNANARGKNNVLQILKHTRTGDVGTIILGPTIDKGPTNTHYYINAEARLSFLVILREANRKCKLISYRFHLHLGAARGPSFLRFDLNPGAHSNPLIEPRSHVHPGRDDIRLPFPVLRPLELLDRIFYVVGNRT